MIELLVALAAALGAYNVWVRWYFRSEEFKAIRASIADHTRNCNELNAHIEDLKSTPLDISAFDYGKSTLADTSNYKMKRRNWHDKENNARTHNCSAAVLKNASDQPFKYLCKYFNIPANAETLSIAEALLNNFSAAEQGKHLLKNERDEIISNIDNSIPATIRLFHRERLSRELGFDNIDLTDLYFPAYKFRYVSAGGNSAMKLDVRLDIENLNRFILYLSALVKFRNSVAGQRSLMTSTLREKIKTRDGFACRICHVSVRDEKHLLLEIDHVIPLSKGGITSEENLQTLCWKCNRSKGAKIASLPLFGKISDHSIANDKTT